MQDFRGLQGVGVTILHMGVRPAPVILMLGCLAVLANWSRHSCTCAIGLLCVYPMRSQARARWRGDPAMLCPARVQV